MPITLGILAQSRQAVAAGAMDLLETQVLTGTQSAIEFTNLSTNYASIYKHLQVRFTGRTSAGGDLVGVRIEFGTGSTPDTGTNYSYHVLEGINGSVNSGGAANSTFADSGVAGGAGSDANAFGAGVIDILDVFSTTKNKTVRTLSGIAQSGNEIILLRSANWRNTGAVNFMKIYPSGTSFVQHTRFSLYGIRG